jgi:hypothetical protein
VAKALPYAAWVRLQLARVPEEELKAARVAYFSDKGKIAKWEAYKAYCKSQKLDYDGPPDGYWEAMEKPWHKPTGYGMAAMGLFAWFLMTIIGTSTGMGNRK